MKTRKVFKEIMLMVITALTLLAGIYCGAKCRELSDVRKVETIEHVTTTGEHILVEEIHRDGFGRVRDLKYYLINA